MLCLSDDLLRDVEDEGIIFSQAIQDGALLFLRTAVIESDGFMTQVQVCMPVEFDGFLCYVRVHTWTETNTSSTRLPGSSKYPNYPIANIQIR